MRGDPIRLAKRKLIGATTLKNDRSFKLRKATSMDGKVEFVNVKEISSRCPDPGKLNEVSLYSNTFRWYCTGRTYLMDIFLKHFPDALGENLKVSVCPTAKLQICDN
jgi:hypothetical protein